MPRLIVSFMIDPTTSTHSVFSPRANTIGGQLLIQEGPKYFLGNLLTAHYWRIGCEPDSTGTAESTSTLKKPANPATR
ncbi:hypothetical protein AUI46_05060 [archaeon 13_1_40CM_2_52_13]|nr:MAG: hypothetical protein AUI46_05060 [archaeon 13_1_40CM_2_52_13]TMI41079.1 MAG: hypothetical protein E6H21_04135 [Candidatus Bathyarchaeota archaeon]